MGRKPKDIIGQRFGRLVVIEDSGKRNVSRGVLWLCKCDCGNEMIVDVCNLGNGATRSCGCLHKEKSKHRMDKMNDVSKAEGTSINNINQKISTANTSGVKGVSWNKKRGVWEVYIKFKKVQKHLGYFKNKNDAINARKEAEEKYFKPILEKYRKTQ